MNLNGIGVTNAWKMLISPPKTSYAMQNLGPTLMSFDKYDSCRVDSSFTNSRGNNVVFSVFVPIKPNTVVESPEQMKLTCPCLIYCHSQGGCRVEGLFLQEFCIEHGIGLCVWDYAGCGRSSGDYITLGWKETDDLAQLIDILTSHYQATQISLWGRSMGGVTSIMFAERSSFFISSMVVLLDPRFSI